MNDDKLIKAATSALEFLTGGSFGTTAMEYPEFYERADKVADALRVALAEAQQGEASHSLTVQTGEDGTWLHFKSSDGKYGSLHVETLAERYGGIVTSCLKQWCKDQDSGPVGGSVLPAATVEDRVKGAPSGGSDAPASTAAIHGTGEKPTDWLQTQIAEAKKDVSEWPEWLKKAAKIEGEKP